MDRVIALAEDRDCWLLSDEVYRGAELNEWSVDLLQELQIKQL